MRDKLTKIDLLDVQGLWGGWEITVKATGEVVVHEVQPTAEGFYRETWLTQWRPGQAQKFLADVLQTGILDYEEVHRYGLPDEARPVIQLFFEDGHTVSLCKWSNDQDPLFDTAYKMLLNLRPVK